MISDELRTQATNFATEIQTVLGSSIAKHVQIRAATSYTEVGRVFVVGHRVGGGNIRPGRFELSTTRKQADLWMEISFQFLLDEEEHYLTARKSFFGVFPSEDAKEGLCHYDYERGKADDYPDAHLQVYGQSQVLESLRQGRALSKLHFPVGGKRYRPCLEDLIQFLAREDLVVARDGYREVLEASRQRFRERQLRAAMRRSPDVVHEYLDEYGEQLGWRRVPKQRDDPLPMPRRPRS